MVITSLDYALLLGEGFNNICSFIRVTDRICTSRVGARAVLGELFPMASMRIVAEPKSRPKSIRFRTATCGQPSAYFEDLFTYSPHFNWKIGMKVGFEITRAGGGNWSVDFRAATLGVYRDLDGVAVYNDICSGP